MTKSLYEKLGVDPRKNTVREIFGKLIDNEYPGAFVNIITDPFCPNRVVTQHQDGDGSKFIQRMIHYLETSNDQVFAGMVDDALSMNSSDIAASGFVFGPWMVTDVLNLNLPPKIKELVLKVIAIRFLELRELYKEHGFDIKFLGGETADLPDQVRSGVFDISITAWAEKSDLITGNVQGGDLIFGFPSDGRASWEEADNSGIMSNGLTLARSCLMKKEYNEQYPFLRRDKLFYQGRFDYNSYFTEEMTIGEALLSPTRQWAIVIKELMVLLKEENALPLLHGISINTGGGATKIANIGQGDILYIKDMPSPSSFFRLIQGESGEDWKNMYQTFNCGVGIDIIGADSPVFIEALKRTAIKCGLPLYRLGVCQRLLSGSKKNEVQLNTFAGTFYY